VPVVAQDPLTFATIRAEVAVSPWVEPDAGVPVTITQSPTTTWPGRTWVNLVAALYTTVFCAVEDWT
jgi:hypothetical protein